MATLLVIDTETGGVDANAHSILTLGMAVWRDGDVGAVTEIAVWEEGGPVVEPEAMRINAIDLNAHRAIAVGPREAVVRCLAFVDQHFGARETRERVALAGHNIAFDVAFLRRLFRLAGADYDAVFSHRTLDTAGIIRFLMLAGAIPDGRAGSDAAFKQFGITVDPALRHTAAGDAAATAQLLTALVNVVRAKMNLSHAPGDGGSWA